MIELHGTAPTWAFVGTAVSDLVVRAVDSAGRPVQGVAVSFRTARGSSVAAARDTTDVSGLATPGAWTLPTTPTADTLVVSAAGASELRLPLVVRAGPVSQLDLLAPATGEGEVLRSMLAGPAFRATDRYGNRVPFAEVELRHEPARPGLVPPSRVVRIVATDTAGVVRIDEWVPRTLGEHTLRAVVVSNAAVTSPVLRRQVRAPACAPIGVLLGFLEATGAGPTGAGPTGSLNADPSLACRDTVDRWAVALARAERLSATAFVSGAGAHERFRLVRAGSLDSSQAVTPSRERGVHALLPAGEYEVVVSAPGTTARVDYHLSGSLGVTSCDATYLLPGGEGELYGNCAVTVREAGITEAPGHTFAWYAAGAPGRIVDVTVDAIEAIAFGSSAPTSHPWTPVLAVYSRTGSGALELITIVRASTARGSVRVPVPAQYTEALIVVTAEGQHGRMLRFRVSAR